MCLLLKRTAYKNCHGACTVDYRSSLGQREQLAQELFSCAPGAAGCTASAWADIHTHMLLAR